MIVLYFNTFFPVFERGWPNGIHGRRWISDYHPTLSLKAKACRILRPGSARDLESALFQTHAHGLLEALDREDRVDLGPELGRVVIYLMSDTMS
jgi:hypothetical protein